MKEYGYSIEVNDLLWERDKEIGQLKSEFSQQVKFLGNQILLTEIQNKIIEKALESTTPEQLHLYYLEAIKNINPESYNEQANKPFEELTKEQRYIDEFISYKIEQILEGKS